MFADPGSFVIVAKCAQFREVEEKPRPGRLWESSRPGPHWLDLREEQQGWRCPLLNTLVLRRTRRLH